MGTKKASRRAFALCVSMLGVLVLVACIGTSRPKACSFTSECDAGICNARGFCESECRTNADCPCGSFCASSCGICIRNDRLGPASCFAFGHGYDTNAVLGACLVQRGDAEAASDASSSVDVSTDDAAVAAVAASSASEAGPCMLVEPVCESSPPLDGAPWEAAPEDASADVSVDVDTDGDADSADASDDADAEVEGGGP